jgi:hypothetical protein
MTVYGVEIKTVRIIAQCSQKKKLAMPSAWKIERLKQDTADM